MFQTRVVAAPGALISWSQTPAISSRVKSVLLAGAAFMNQDRPDQPEASGKRTHVGSDRRVTQSQQIAYSTCDRQSTSNIAGHPTQPILIPFPAVILITTSWWDIAMGKVGPSFARTCSTTSPKRGRIATSVRPPQTSAQRPVRQLNSPNWGSTQAGYGPAHHRSSRLTRTAPGFRPRSEAGLREFHSNEFALLQQQHPGFVRRLPG